MKTQQLPVHREPSRIGTNYISRPNTNTNLRLPIALIALSYIILLVVSYSLGYLVGSAFTIKHITPFVISKTSSTSKYTVPWSYDLVRNKLAVQCAEPVPPEFIRQAIIDRVYNGTSPYENFIPPRGASPMQPEKNTWGSFEVIYKSLIHKVRPKIIIKFGTSLDISPTYLANLTRQLGLETQLLCVDEFQSWPVRDLFEDIGMPIGDYELLNQFSQYVISQNATESILPVPISMHFAPEKLCEWGIYGDLIEVDAGLDFHSAWSDINKAYKLLRPGGVLFGHSNYSSFDYKGVRQAIRLFSRINKFRVKADGHHWRSNST